MAAWIYKCRIISQVESSSFEGRLGTLMVCSYSPAGVAPGAVAQSRGDGVGSGSNRYEALPQAITIRVVLTGREAAAACSSTSRPRSSNPAASPNCSSANVGLKSCQSGCLRIASACRCVLADRFRFDGRRRRPCTTTASPCFAIRFTSFHTQRTVTPIFSAASRWLLLPSLTRFSQSR